MQIVGKQWQSGPKGDPKGGPSWRYPGGPQPPQVKIWDPVADLREKRKERRRQRRAADKESVSAVYVQFLVALTPGSHTSWFAATLTCEHTFALLELGAYQFDAHVSFFTHHCCSNLLNRVVVDGRSSGMRHQERGGRGRCCVVSSPHAVWLVLRSSCSRIPL